MTSISATSSNSYQSPLQQLLNELQNEAGSGAIGSSDQAVLSSALTDINASLQSGNAGASAGGTPPSPADLKSKIDDLIAGEVSSGKLTADQATELQGIFQAAFAGAPSPDNQAATAGSGDASAAAASGDPKAPAGPGGAGGVHHGHHGGHRHGGTAPAESSSSTADAGSSSGTGTANDVLQQFLQSLQNSLSTSSSPSYGASGASDAGGNGNASLSALLINYQA